MNYLFGSHDLSLGFFSSVDIYISFFTFYGNKVSGKLYIIRLHIARRTKNINKSIKLLKNPSDKMFDGLQ